MRSFVTKARGYVGSAVVKDMLAAGHEVIGLLRSEDSAGKLLALGADPLRRSGEPAGSSQEGFNSEKHNARECGVRYR